MDYIDSANKTAKVTAEERALSAAKDVPTQNGGVQVKQDDNQAARKDKHSHQSHLNHSVSAKDEPSTPSPKGSKDSRLGQTGRRNSWMTSLSSKFSSSTANAATSSPEVDPTSNIKPPKSPKAEQPNPLGHHAGAKDIKKTEVSAPSPPVSPKNQGFLSSALRRLSSSGNASLGKATGSGGICPRKTMNVDPYRERCAVLELDQNKLRRVAFCVDVEIAGSAQYVDNVEQPGAIPLDAEPSLSKMEKEMAEKKQKNKKLSRSEGEALKRPPAVAEEETTKDAETAKGESEGLTGREMTEAGKINGHLVAQDPMASTRNQQEKGEKETV